MDSFKNQKLRSCYRVHRWRTNGWSDARRCVGSGYHRSLSIAMVFGQCLSHGNLFCHFIMWYQDSHWHLCFQQTVISDIQLRFYKAILCITISLVRRRWGETSNPLVWPSLVSHQLPKRPFIKTTAFSQLKGHRQLMHFRGMPFRSWLAYHRIRYLYCG